MNILLLATAGILSGSPSLTADQSALWPPRPAAALFMATPVKDVPYVPTPQAVVNRMLELASVGPKDVVYDLGSGDGRLVISAVRDRNARRAVGIDIDPERIQESLANAESAGVTDRVTFREGNIFEEKFDEATVITMYLLSSVNRRLRPRLLSELEPGTRLVSHAFDMADWQPDVHDTVDDEGRTFHVYFWTVPANVSGSWTVTSQKEDARVEIEQQFQTFTGSAGGTTISDGKVDGRKVSFRLVSPDGVELGQFRGELNGETLTGTLKNGDGERAWSAKRKENTARPLDESEETRAGAAPALPLG